MNPARRHFLGWGAGLVGAALGVFSIARIPDRDFFVPAAVHGGGDGRWACPMLCTFLTKPGTCPICGMVLERMVAGELNREQRRRMGVTVATAVARPAIATVRGYGRVRFDERRAHSVTARVSGRIVARHGGALHPGLPVAAGDTLLDLYSPEAYAAQAELAAARRLGDERLMAALRQRFARWNPDAVAAAIVAGGEPRDTIAITSPADGLVPADGLDDSLRIGAEIAAGTPLLRVVDPHAFIIAVRIPEARARWLRRGQRARLRSDDHGELPEMTARIAWLAPGLSATTSSRELHLHAQDDTGRLLDGSLVEARIEAALAADLGPADPEDPTTLGHFVQVPATALLSTGLREVVWRLAERRADGSQHFVPVSVATGARVTGSDGIERVIIRAGLAAGDEVAEHGAFLIDSQAQLAGTPSLLFPSGTLPEGGQAH
jgi:multidrug efflux pump subunit AcrA (membrane-fusion protein)